MPEAEAETGLREVGERLALVVARLAFVHGDGDPHLAEPLQWAGTGPAHQLLTTVHHADVSQALWRAAVTTGIAGRTYNTCDDAPLTAWDLHTLNGAGCTPAAALGGTEFDPREGVGSTAAARRDLGWRPQYPSAWAALEAGALSGATRARYRQGAGTPDHQGVRDRQGRGDDQSVHAVPRRPAAIWAVHSSMSSTGRRPGQRCARSAPGKPARNLVVTASGATGAPRAGPSAHDADRRGEGESSAV